METMDPRDMTPRQIAEALGVDGDNWGVVAVNCNGSGAGPGGSISWSSPADFARLVEERRRKTDAEVLAADIAKARKQLPNMRQEPQSLLASIGWRIARGVLLPEWKQPVVEQQAKPPAPQEDPPLTVAEVAEYGKWSRKPTLVGICGTIFGNGIKMTIPELTAIVRGGAK